MKECVHHRGAVLFRGYTTENMKERNRGRELSATHATSGMMWLRASDATARDDVSEAGGVEFKANRENASLTVSL